MLFSAVATTSLVLTCTTTTALESLLGLGTVLTTTRGRRWREVRRGIGRSGFGRKESKRVPPLLVRRAGIDVGGGGGRHTELLVAQIY
jgi:hypothetical protein